MKQFKENRDFEAIEFEDKRIVFLISNFGCQKEKAEKTAILFKKVVNVAIPTINSYKKGFLTY